MDNEQKKFFAFEKVRMSGVTNMIDRPKVIELAKFYFDTELTKDEVLECMSRYNEFANKYLDSNTISILRAEVRDAELDSYDEENLSDKDYGNNGEPIKEYNEDDNLSDKDFDDSFS